MENDACGIIVSPAVPGNFRAALELVLGDLPHDERQRVVEQMLHAVAQGRRSLDGLLIGHRDGQLVGAVWAEIQPGRTANVWPPQVAGNRCSEIDAPLLAEMTRFLAASHVRMAQSLLTADATSTAESLRGAGFEHLTDLLYLMSTTAQFPTAPVARALAFEPVQPADEARLAATIDATYEQTLDCPRLDGLRDAGDVLTGYRATAHDDTSHWYLVRRGELDVGCLLLARHDEVETWEVVYMGLALGARGAGLGIEMARHAQWLVRAAGGDRLMLAVDAANEPAIKVYAAAGFVTFDRRRVFVRFFDG